VTAPAESSPLEAAVAATLRAAGCVFAEDEARLLVEASRDAAGLETVVGRRVAGEPLEHLLGWADFCGLRVLVDAGVFVPRRRTELLVEQAIELATARPVVLDLCCGSGAVGAALAAGVDGVELYAADLDAASVRCARRNLEPLGGRVFEGDLFEPLPATLVGRVDLLAANVPYVPTDQIAMMPPEARLHEPRVALDGGPDGLATLRRVAAQAPRWLAPGGHLLSETSRRQAPAALEVLEGCGLSARVVADDERGANVVIGTRPAP